MQKFTIFTILLTIVVVVVVAEVAVNEYLPDTEQNDEGKLGFTLPKDLDIADTIKTDISSGRNYLGADVDAAAISADTPVERNVSSNSNLDEELSEISELDFLPLYDEEGGSVFTPISSSDLPDFEDTDFTRPKVTAAPNVYLREEHIKSAGFTGADLRTDSADGKLFKTIEIGDLEDTEVEKYIVQTDDALLAKVYVFKMGIQADGNEIYNALKSRADEEPTAEINETNQYGSASFYMNDSQRSSSVFLTVRIGPLIYSFSYPKEYHPQIKNLIQLLMWELG